MKPALQLPRVQSPRAPNAGLSMIETIVSATLLLVAILAAVRVEIASRNLRHEAQETSVAMNLLARVESDLQAQPLAELADPGGAFAPGAPLAAPAVFADQVVQYTTPGYAPGAALPRVLNLRITLNWTSSTGATRATALTSSTR